jgi:hypothetical protein
LGQVATVGVPFPPLKISTLPLPSLVEMMSETATSPFLSTEQPTGYSPEMVRLFEDVAEPFANSRTLDSPVLVTPASF